MLTEIVEGLAGTKVEEQDAAADKLSGLSKQGLSLRDGMEALRAAAKSFPPRGVDWEDSSADLIEAAAETHHAEACPYPHVPNACRRPWSHDLEEGKNHTDSDGNSVLDFVPAELRHGEE